ncbi:tetratricopeptide repeat protein [Actinospica sp.]|uniref:tetratricopeptide repeat protein n=1 Tax=Actinospica sp. TaxID=1872142 RepID=UPI002C935AA3|nr:tetratricopeptide repeat protein [Actinospica sp.]HWG23023.1 tetratricopeptide repeat protein [Actinospica sp.]
MPRDSARRAIELLVDESWELNTADRSLQALATAERAVLAARRFGDAGLLVRALTTQASAQRLLGENSAAMVSYVEVFRLAEDPKNEQPLAHPAAVRAIGSAHMSFVLVVRLRGASTKEQLLALIAEADDWFVQTGHPHWRAGLLLQRAEVHLDHGEAEPALEHARAAYETYNPSAPGYTMAYHHNCLGRALLAADRGDEAAEHFQTVIEAPTSAPYDRMLSNFYLSDYHERANRAELALRYMDDAVRLSEYCEGRYAQAMALARRGKLLRARNRFPDALADLDRAVAYAPSYMWAVAQRGIAHRLAENYDRAVADYDAAIKLNPTVAWVHAERGAALLALGRHADALTDFDRALELDPSDTWAAEHRQLTGDALDSLRAGDS